MKLRPVYAPAAAALPIASKPSIAGVPLRSAICCEPSARIRLASPAKAALAVRPNKNGAVCAAICRREAGLSLNAPTALPVEPLKASKVLPKPSQYSEEPKSALARWNAPC